jgi:proline racemase
MCGSDTIATVTALIETGQISARDAEAELHLDTPAGLIVAHPRISDGKVDAVTFRNAPAYAAALDAKIDVDGYGPVVVDIGYGGNFYAITSADQFGLKLGADMTTEATRVAEKVRAAVNATIDVTHPEIPEVRGVTHVQFYTDAAPDGTSARVMVIVPPGLVDRSPCGTGTTAKVATLVAKGVLQPGQTFTHHSVTGAFFTGRAVEPAQVGPYPGQRVEITGQSFLIADTTLYVDHRDPLALGFLLR